MNIAQKRSANYGDLVPGLTANLNSGMVGGLVAAYFVHLLTKSRDHASWVRNSRIKEWQELLELLSKSHMTLLIDPHAFDAESKTKYNLKQLKSFSIVSLTSRSKTQTT